MKTNRACQCRCHLPTPPNPRSHPLADWRPGDQMAEAPWEVCEITPSDHEDVLLLKTHVAVRCAGTLTGVCVIGDASIREYRRLAHLIAAAPEMRDLLIELESISHSDEWSEGSGRLDEALAKMRTLIASVVPPARKKRSRQSVAA